MDRGLGNALCDLGILALYEGRHDDAVPLFRDALESALRTGWRVNVAYSLRGLSGVLAAAGELEPAARTLGAAHAIEEQIGEFLQGYAVEAFDAASAPVLERLDEPGIAAAYAAGAAMTDLEASEYALAAVADTASH